MDPSEPFLDLSVHLQQKGESSKFGIKSRTKTLTHKVHSHETQVITNGDGGWSLETVRGLKEQKRQVPLLEVSGPLAVVQLLETSLLCLVNYARYPWNKSISTESNESFLIPF